MTQTPLQAQLLSSTGLFLQCGPSSILVDALNGKIQSFKAVPPETAREIIDGHPPYRRIDGLFYSHLHPDHYDQALNAAFLRSHPGVTTFFPTAATPDRGMVRAGDFTVEYQYLEHIPCDYTWAKHYVFWITAGGVTLYLTTDAMLSPAAHLAFLDGRRADYGFWNSIYLSHAETRALLHQAARRTYIYHMPEPAHDDAGICRKAARNLERWPEALADVTVLTSYPTQLSLPSLS